MNRASIGNAEDLVDMILHNRQTGKTTVLLEGVKAYKEKYPFSPQPAIITMNAQSAEILKKHHEVLAVPISVVRNLRGADMPILVEPEVLVHLLMDVAGEASLLQTENEKLRRVLKKFKSLSEEVDYVLY